MLFYRNDAVDKIIEIWKNQFTSAATEKKILLIYVVSEVISQSAKKGKLEFVKAFGDILVECFTDIM